MRTDCLNSTDFQGKVVILNNLSHKPYLCIKKVENNLTKQINSKNYNLYIEQDYSLNKMNIGVSLLRPRTMSGTIEHEELPITSKSNRYIYAAKSAIETFEKNIAKTREEKYVKEQKQRNSREAFTALGMAPLFFLCFFADAIIPNGGEKVEKFLNKAIKVAKKKG